MIERCDRDWSSWLLSSALCFFLRQCTISPPIEYIQYAYSGPISIPLYLACLIGDNISVNLHCLCKSCISLLEHCLCTWLWHVCERWRETKDSITSPLTTTKSMDSLASIVDLSQNSLWITIGSVFFNPIFWNTVARLGTFCSFGFPWP